MNAKGSSPSKSEKQSETMANSLEPKVTSLLWA